MQYIRNLTLVEMTKGYTKYQDEKGFKYYVPREVSGENPPKTVQMQIEG